MNNLSCLQETHFRSKDTHMLKGKGWGRRYCIQIVTERGYTSIMDRTTRWKVKSKEWPMNTTINQVDLTNIHEQVGVIPRMQGWFNMQNYKNDVYTSCIAGGNAKWCSR